jgi:hypothetical protein
MNALDKFIRGRRDRAGARYETFGGNIYVTEDGCRRAYYQNEVICSMYLTGRHYRHYCYDITGRLKYINMDSPVDVMEMAKICEFTFVGSSVHVKMRYNRGDHTRVMSFDEYVDKFSTFFWPVTREKIWAGLLAELLPQPIAEEIGEHMV